jgi:hypothetical protein
MTGWLIRMGALAVVILWVYVIYAYGYTAGYFAALLSHLAPLP